MSSKKHKHPYRKKGKRMKYGKQAEVRDAEQNESADLSPSVENESTQDAIINLPSSNRQPLAKWIVFLFGFLLYANTIPFGYVLDDKISITHNAFTKDGIDGIWELMTTDYFVGFYGKQKNLVAGGRYRPLSLITFALEYEFFGASPKISHLVNALLYGLLGLLLFRALSACFDPPRGPTWWWSIPFLASLLFMAHPLHAEVVANIKSRDEIMSLMGALAALISTISYIQTKAKKHLLLSALFFFLGLFAKESAIVFLGIIPLTLYFFFAQKPSELFKACWPLVIGTLAYVAARYGAIGSAQTTPVKELMNNPYVYAESGEKFATIFYTMGLYLKLLVLPHPLTHDYYPKQIPLIGWGDWRALLSLVLYAMLIFLAIKGWKQRKLYAYCILFYLMAFSLFSNLLFNIGSFMNERFMFVASIGFCIWIAHWAIQAAQKNTQSRLLQGMMLIALLALSAKTISRNTAWESDFTLSTTDVKVSSNSAKSNMSAGGSFVDMARETKNPTEKQQYINKAIKHLNKSLKIYPTYYQPMVLLGNAYYEMKQYETSLVYFENSLKVKPGYKVSINSLEHVGDKCNEAEQYETALKAYQLALKYGASKVRLYGKLGEIHGKGLGQLDASFTYLKKAYDIDSNNTSILQKLGIVYALKGQFPMAISTFKRGMDIDSNNAHIALNLGLTLKNVGDHEQGDYYLGRVRKLNPELIK